MKVKPHLRSSGSLGASILAVAFCSAIALLLQSSVYAQSTRRNSPTPLRSTEVSGRADYPVPRGGGYARTFYYTFMAGPGEVRGEVITNPTARGAYEYTVVFEDDRGRRLEAVTLISGGGGESRRDKSFSLPRRTRVLMTVKVTGRFDYQIRLEGVVNISLEPAEGEDGTLERPGRRPAPGGTRVAVPRRGTLLIRMRDGSTREIDLSLVTDVTVIDR